MCKYAADHDVNNLSDGSDTEPMEPNRSTKRNCPPGTALTPTNPTSELSTSGPTQLKNGDGTGVLEELAMRMERLEKHMMGRSPTATELSASRVSVAPFGTIRGLSVKNGGATTRYFGQNSPRIMMNLFYDGKSFLARHQHIRGAQDVFMNFRALHSCLKDDYKQALAPITVFVDSMMPVQTRMRDILPQKEVCDKLVRTYIDTSETIYRILHVPTFMKEYTMYWDGKLQSESFLPKLLSVLATASRFDTKSRGLGHERKEGVHIPTASALVRSWLDNRRGRQSIDFSGLQVEVLLLHSKRVFATRHQEMWTEMAHVVRTAMAMGMHRDPIESEPRLGVFQGELRRRLWYTILDMDLHSSLASSLPCTLRDGDFTTRPPRNLDDVELFEGMTDLPPSRPIDQHTDNQLQVHAATTLASRMKVAHLVNRIDSLKDYQEVLDVASKLDRYLEDINFIYPREGNLDDAQRSKAWRSRVILDMHVRRPLLALYRPLALGVPDVPPQIFRAYLRSCMTILKYLDELDPRLPHFAAIAGMYHQMLKVDIIQCAISVCYYVQISTRPTAENVMLAQHAMKMDLESGDESSRYASDTVPLWSPTKLIVTVENTMQLLVTHMSGSDTKDIVALALALEVARYRDPRDDEILRGLYTVFDMCLRATGMTVDRVHGVARLRTEAMQREAHMRGVPATAIKDPAAMADFGSWIIWDGWE